MVMTILRRLRGSIATVLAWGVTWGILGTGYFFGNAAWRDFLGRQTSCVTLGLTGVGVLWVIWGAVGAVVFCAAMMLAERGRAIGTLSTTRVAGWGALGGVAPPLAIIGVFLAETGGEFPTELVPALAVGALLGAGCAAGALALARRGEQPAGR